MKLKSASLLAFRAMVTALVLVATAASTSAAWQPTKPVTFLIMAGKGGGADKATRLLIDIIAKNGLASVEFEPVNMPGGSGAEALSFMRKKSGDAHTILFTLNSFYTTPLRRPELGIDIASFVPIARMGEDNFLLWVGAERTDINTIDDFVNVVRATGDKWVMGGTGTGSEDSMLTDWLNSTYGLKMSYKEYDGGGDVAKALAANEVQSTVNNPSEQKGIYDEGKTKSIVAFSGKRLPAYESSPSLHETGMDFNYLMQRSVVGAPKMPKGAADYYQKLFKAVFETAEWQDYRKKQSLEGEFLSGQRLLDYWLAEREKHVRWIMVMDTMKAAQ